MSKLDYFERGMSGRYHVDTNLPSKGENVPPGPKSLNMTSACARLATTLMTIAATTAATRLHFI